MDVASIERLLETYSLEDILSDNALTEADALYILVECGEVQLPEVRPVDYE